MKSLLSIMFLCLIGLFLSACNFTSSSDVAATPPAPVVPTVPVVQYQYAVNQTVVLGSTSGQNILGMYVSTTHLIMVKERRIRKDGGLVVLVAMDGVRHTIYGATDMAEEEVTFYLIDCNTKMGVSVEERKYTNGSDVPDSDVVTPTAQLKPQKINLTDGGLGAKTYTVACATVDGS